ncbi:MAG: HAMP domain-containing histidine kinase [Coleofasciculaceae cyanobacterium RL_1_1]|nr:HAMP domain-containing histidine kinase [Coleofasciculaceae cyanobacterium RL_1_1]
MIHTGRISSKTGTARIRDIVSGLRTFSRIDESPCKEIDLHESIDSTLIILRSRLKGKGEYPEIDILRNYGNLTAIECYSGELNQVFMNIFGNAIDAIKERYRTQLTHQTQPQAGQIEITTQLDDPQTVRVTIVDNGLGMGYRVYASLVHPKQGSTLSLNPSPSRGRGTLNTVVFVLLPFSLIRDKGLGMRVNDDATVTASYVYTVA